MLHVPAPRRIRRAPGRVVPRAPRGVRRGARRARQGPARRRRRRRGHASEEAAAADGRRVGDQPSRAHRSSGDGGVRGHEPAGRGGPGSGAGGRGRGRVRVAGGGGARERGRDRARRCSRAGGPRRRPPAQRPLAGAGDRDAQGGDRRRGAARPRGPRPRRARAVGGDARCNSHRPTAQARPALGSAPPASPGAARAGPAGGRARRRDRAPAAAERSDRAHDGGAARGEAQARRYEARGDYSQAPRGRGAPPGRLSRIRLRAARSLRLARRTARSITGAAIRANPDGSPRLRSPILVPPPGASAHVYVVSIARGPSVVAITKRSAGTISLTSYTYDSRRPRNRATKAHLDPIAAGRGVSHSTDSMFAYHSVALSGSEEYAATSPRARPISISVVTSIATARSYRRSL